MRDIQTVAWAAVGVALLVPALAHAQNVKGTVVDDVGKPIPGVDVTIYPVGRSNPIAHVKTDAQGNYNLQPRGQAPLDLAYTHTKMVPAFVTLLSGSSGQNINKVMYLKTTQAVQTNQAKLEAMDRLLYLVAAVPERERHALVASFAERGISVDDDFRGLSDVPLQDNDIGRYQKAKIAMLLAQYQALLRP